MPYSEENENDGIVHVTDKTRNHLNPRQEIDYRNHCRELAEWILTRVKELKFTEGELTGTLGDSVTVLPVVVALGALTPAFDSAGAALVRRVPGRPGRRLRPPAVGGADDGARRSRRRRHRLLRRTRRRWSVRQRRPAHRRTRGRSVGALAFVLLERFGTSGPT